jgi:hypothetical protein
VKKATKESHLNFSIKNTKSTPMPTIAEVQEVFKGQEVTEVDGGFAIRTQSGQDLIIKSVDHISPNRTALNIGYGQNALKDGSIIAGKYQTGTIELTKGVADKWTLSHESVHFMEDIGVLNANEINLLQRHIKNLVNAGKFKTANQKDIGGAEDRANFLADALSKEPKRLFARIINKIKEFIDKMVNAFGIRTVKGIQRDVKSGEIYGRKPGGKFILGANDLYGEQYSIIRFPDKKTAHWWDSRDIQAEINALPKKYFQGATRNLIAEGYVPITRAEADELYKNKLDQFIAWAQISGQETTGFEGLFMRPLTFQGYSERRYADGKWETNQEAKDLYRKHKERFVSNRTGNTKATVGRDSAALREESQQDAPMQIAAEPNEQYSIRRDPSEETALYYPGGLENNKSAYKLEEATGNVTTQTSTIIKDEGRVARIAATVSKEIGREIAPENIRLYERNKLDDLGKLGRAFQKKIIVFQGEGEDLSGLPAFFDSSSPGTIYLNAETGDPHLIILGHELLHAMKHDAPDIYNGFISHVEATEYFIERKVQYDKVYGRKITSNEAVEEYAADFIGLQFIKPEFWEDLSNRKPGIFKKVYTAFTRLLNKLKGVVLKTNKFFADMKKAERSAAKAMADYAERIRKDERGAVGLDINKPKEETALGRDLNIDSLAGSKLGIISDMAKDLISAYKRPPEWTESKRIIGKYTGALQIIDQKLSVYAKDINAKITKDKQIAITYYMQAGGDENLLIERAQKSKQPYKKGYEDAAKLTDEEKQLAETFRERYDGIWEEAQKAGVIEDYMDDYVRGEWAKPNKATRILLAQVNAGLFNRNAKEALSKVFKNYFEGEQAGQTPKDRRIGYQLVAAERSIRQAIETRKALKSLMHSTEKDGRPTVVVGGSGTMLTDVDTGEVEAFFVKPNDKGANSGDYKFLDHPSLRKWKFIKADSGEKPIFMEGNMWIHPAAFSRINALIGRSKIKEYTLPERIPVIGGTAPGAAALRASSFIKGTYLIGPFHQFHVGEHGVFHKVNPFNAPEIDFEKRPILKEGVEHGLMLFNHNAIYEFGEGLASGGLWHKIPGIGHVLKIYQEWLFQGFIPRLKAAMFEHAVTRAEKYYEKDLTSGKLTRDQLLDNAAKQANAAFGEMNYKYIGRNPTLQDALRLGLLAPDFLEARLKFAGQALRPKGKEQAMALVRGALIMGVTAQVLNVLIGDDHKPHWNRPFSLIIGGREYTPRSVVADIGHLIINPRSFWYHRLNPLWGRPLVELYTKRDFYGRKVEIDDTVKNTLKSWIPIPAQGLVKKNTGDNFIESTINALLSSIGVTNYPYKSDFEKYYYSLDKPSYVESDENKQKREFKNDLVDALRREEPGAAEKLKKARAKGMITYKEYRSIQKRATENPVVRIAKHMTLPDLAEGIEKHATSEERKLLYHVFKKKYYNNAKKLDIQEKKKYNEIMKKMRSEEG